MKLIYSSPQVTVEKRNAESVSREYTVGCGFTESLEMFNQIRKATCKYHAEEHTKVKVTHLPSIPNIFKNKSLKNLNKIKAHNVA